MRTVSRILAIVMAFTLAACSKPAPEVVEEPEITTEEFSSAPLPKPEPVKETKVEGEAQPSVSPPPAAEREPVEETSQPEPLPPLVPPTAPPASTDPDPAPEPEPAKTYFLEPGMSHAEVVKMYGNPGQVVIGNPPEDGVVRWTLEGGGSVQVRFKGGQVDRFTSYAAKSQPGPEMPPVQQITKAQYDQIAPGMSLYEVTEFLDIEGKLMATGDDGEKVYRWSDELGGGFSARFEDDKLTLKTGFAEPVMATETSSEGIVEGEYEGDAAALEAMAEVYEDEDFIEGEGEYLEEERALPPAVRTVYSSRPLPEEEGGAPGQQVYRAEGRVNVVGKSRADYGVEESAQQEETYRDRRRRARLPEYKHSLRRGVYEVRVLNESGSALKVGLRQGKNGKDLSIGSGGSGSFQLDRGSYELYYVAGDQPYDLVDGPTVNIDGQANADLQVVINAEGASIRNLDLPIFN